ncbi:MAG: hemerythrin domain-containing protein [bacterium]|nr:hemerythrin domain-containing protein [bacterium]
MSPSERTPPPSLDQIREQHLALEQTTNQLRDALENPAPEAKQRALFAEELARFEVSLNEHFALEEDGGYFADVLAVAPRLSARAAQLEQAHKDLCQQLARLRTRTKNPDSPWEDVAKALRRFFAELKSHGSAEDDMVHEAFMRDLGG